MKVTHRGICEATPSSSEARARRWREIGGYHFFQVFKLSTTLETQDERDDDDDDEASFIQIAARRGGPEVPGHNFLDILGCVDFHVFPSGIFPRLDTVPQTITDAIGAHGKLQREVSNTQGFIEDFPMFEERINTAEVMA
ncbi:AAEL000592-PA [Aedes aegypti]|uniref:AAEL000592-PA n=1 Tax=Aedes aegypti TaxID=7159 RepID=Q17NU6_AEDAE|nr:AAEL000592-PA [Aedes aegypti]